MLESAPYIPIYISICRIPPRHAFLVLPDDWSIILGNIDSSCLIDGVLRNYICLASLHQLISHYKLRALIHDNFFFLSRRQQFSWSYDQPSRRHKDGGLQLSIWPRVLVPISSYSYLKSLSRFVAIWLIMSSRWIKSNWVQSQVNLFSSPLLYPKSHACARSLKISQDVANLLLPSDRWRGRCTESVLLIPDHKFWQNPGF